MPPALMDHNTFPGSGADLTKCAQNTVMSYVTQGRHCLVLQHTHAFSVYGPFITVQITPAGTLSLQLNWAGRHVGPALYGLRPLRVIQVFFQKSGGGITIHWNRCELQSQGTTVCVNWERSQPFCTCKRIRGVSSPRGLYI
jgi:hypothetical protein